MVSIVISAGVSGVVLASGLVVARQIKEIGVSDEKLLNILVTRANGTVR
jgi:hypothetical protein